MNKNQKLVIAAGIIAFIISASQAPWEKTTRLFPGNQVYQTATVYAPIWQAPQPSQFEMQTRDEYRLQVQQLGCVWLAIIVVCGGLCVVLKGKKKQPAPLMNN